MKRLLAIAGLLCGQAFAAITLVQANNTPNTAAVASATMVYTSAVGSGDLLSCGIRWALTTDTVTVSDNINGSWTAAPSSTIANSTNFSEQMFYFQNSASASASGMTVTAAVSPTNTNIAIACIDFAGAATTNALDGTVSTKAVTTTATSITSNAYTSSGSADVLVAFLATGANVTAITAGASYTIPTNGTHTRGGVEYQIGVAAGSNTASISWTTLATASIILGGFLSPSASADIGVDKRHRLEALEE